MSLNLSSLLGGGLILRQQLITANGTWTRPAKMAGDTVWLTMIGGGSSGRRISGVGSGGWGGQWLIDLPVDIGAATSVACTIGVGGAGVAVNVASKPGGPTSFGAFASVAGGAIAAATGGAPGGVGSSRPNGSDTPLGYGGICVLATDAYAAAGAGLILDASGVSGGTDIAYNTPALGYGAGGAVAEGAKPGSAGAPGAILVQWPEFI